MFELWLFELIEILDPWDGYGEISLETLGLILDMKVNKNRDIFLNKSYWDKL